MGLKGVDYGAKQSIYDRKECFQKRQKHYNSERIHRQVDRTYQYFGKKQKCKLL